METKQKIQQNESGFYYIQLNSGAHNHRKTRIWVHKNLVDADSEYSEVKYPLENAKVFTTSKGGFVIRPERNHYVYLVEISSGFRGSADIGPIIGGDIVIKGHELHSGQGALGSTAWAVINSTNNYIQVKGYKTGRRVSENNVDYILNFKGEIKETMQEDIQSLLM